MLAVALAPGAPDRGQVGRWRYHREDGPPVRVAVDIGRGVADNWSAVVHDPSGRMALATGWDISGDQQAYSAPPDVQDLFGGDVVGCARLEGDWYVCGLT